MVKDRRQKAAILAISVVKDRRQKAAVLAKWKAEVEESRRERGSAAATYTDLPELEHWNETKQMCEPQYCRSEKEHYCDTQFGACKRNKKKGVLKGDEWAESDACRAE